MILMGESSPSVLSNIINNALETFAIIYKIKIKKLAKPHQIKSDDFSRTGHCSSRKIYFYPPR